jgi:hypothetical protein
MTKQKLSTALCNNTVFLEVEEGNANENSDQESPLNIGLRFQGCKLATELNNNSDDCNERQPCANGRAVRKIAPLRSSVRIAISIDREVPEYHSATILH